jgi:DNA-binding NarL/FixJ family response regulator
MHRVLIVDDSDIFRQSLRTIMRTCSEWEVCGEAENADKGARFAEALKPDVVLMDISMPGMNGIEAIQHICSKVPHSRIVIVSLYESKELVKSVFEAGARGYVAKPRADLDLIDALKAVTEGETYVSPVSLKARSTQA